VTTINYDAIYKGWDKLPDCRIRIDLGDGGERLWGKRLPDGTIGLNNDPLYAEYRWQDIVRENGSRPVVLHRRWNVKLWFEYKPGATETADLKRRKAIVEACKTVDGTHPNFWMAGSGFILCETPAVVKKARAALGKLTEIEKLTEEKP